MPAGANSSLVYGPDGEWVAGYRKTHLYEEDMYWAEAGKQS
jgi:protein N-terminal amidase